MTIKELREKYNLTQSALARSLGVSSNAISGIEAGRIKLSPKMTAKIKEVYGEELTTIVPEKAAPKKAAPKKSEETGAPIEAPVEKKAAKKPAPMKAVAEKPAETVTAEVAAPIEAPDETAVEKKAPAKKAAPKKAPAKTTADKTATVVAETATPVEAPVEKKVAKKKATEKKAPAKKKAPVEKKAPAKPAPTIILQSEFGGEVTAEQILSKVGDVDKVYVRVDQNKLYWVKGDETGDKDIW